MKLTGSLAVISVLAAQAMIVAARSVHPDVGFNNHGSLRARQNNRNGQNRNGGNRNGGFRGGNGRNGNNQSSTAAVTSAAPTAAVTTSAAAATTSAAAAGNNGGNNNNNGNNNGNNTGNNNTGNNNNNGNNGNNGGNDPELTLDPALIGPNLANNGLVAGAEAGQVASLTSTNNFINFCGTVNQPITNGQQIAGGSCNPVPMGQLPSKDRMPSCKFVNPKNGDTIPANQDFTISLAVKNLITGNFVNPNTNYFGAPQQLQGGVIVAHSHVVVEKLTSLDQTTATNPEVFSFFKGLNLPANGGVLTAAVTGGLPAGFYKVSSINTAANHQPVVGPVAQHGSFDDVSYFTVE